MPIEIYMLLAGTVGITWILAQEVQRRNFRKRKIVILKNMMEKVHKNNSDLPQMASVVLQAFKDLTI